MQPLVYKDFSQKGGLIFPLSLEFFLSFFFFMHFYSLQQK